MPKENHPTAAGLLMFGYEYEITREFPNYFLDYQENRILGPTRWTDRIVSTSGDWSGNVFDFVIESLNRMQQGLKVPFVLKGNQRVDDTPIHKLLREAITNTVVHADFYGRQGIVIQKSEDGYKFSNPGCVRISISEAINGGISDPRNGIMLKMFSLIEFGERAGSGLCGISTVWNKVFHTQIMLEETHNNGVDRTALILSTGGNEQDIQAMLDLYEGTVETSDQKTDRKTGENRPENIKVKGLERDKLKQLALQFIQNASEEGTRRELIIEHLKDALPVRNTKEQNQRLVGNILVELSNDGSVFQKNKIWLATNNKNKISTRND